MEAAIRSIALRTTQMIPPLTMGFCVQRFTSARVAGHGIEIRRKKPTAKSRAPDPLKAKKPCAQFIKRTPFFIQYITIRPNVKR